MQHLANVKIQRTVKRRQFRRRCIFALDRYAACAKKQGHTPLRMAVLDIVINNIVTLREFAKEFAKDLMLPRNPLDRLFAVQGQIEADVKLTVAVSSGLTRTAIEQCRVSA